MGDATRREREREAGQEIIINQLLLTMMPMPPLSQIPHSSSSSVVDPSQPIAETQMGNNTTSSRKRAGTNSESLKTERDRRLKMTHMFTQLQATVPGVLPKVHQMPPFHTILWISCGFGCLRDPLQMGSQHILFLNS